VQYDSIHGVLEFSQVNETASKPCAWVTDAKYADFSARIEFSSGAPPTLRLGETSVGEAGGDDAPSTCRLPVVDTSAGGTLQLARRGSQLTVKLGAQSVSCIVPGERVPLGVCGSQLGAVALTLLSVTRAN
jgi:hypothetical protein